MSASPEVQAWLSQLQHQEQRIGTRTRWLAGAAVLAALFAIVVLVRLYRATIGSYAVLDEVAVTRYPGNQGRLEVAFQVLSPGKVYYRRASADITTEVVDLFYSPGEVKRSWAWAYKPGSDIEVKLRYRRGLLPRTVRETFPTAGRADIVVLIDTTGSMSPSIAELQEKCLLFSHHLSRQALKHRFALIGFGDRKEGQWIDKYEFINDVTQFQRVVGELKRFDGGDLPESALDALEVALSLPFDPEAARRFYLVTDAGYHEPTADGAKAADIAARLEQAGVLLHVFSKPQLEDQYKILLGNTGIFMHIERFGKVLSEGRILED